MKCVYNPDVESKYQKILRDINLVLENYMKTKYPDAQIILKFAYRGAVVGDIYNQDKPCDLDFSIQPFDKEGNKVNIDLTKYGFNKSPFVKELYYFDFYTEVVAKINESFTCKKADFTYSDHLPDYKHSALILDENNQILELVEGALDAAKRKQLIAIEDRDSLFEKNPVSWLRGLHRELVHGFIFEGGLRQYVHYLMVERLNVIKVLNPEVDVKLGRVKPSPWGCFVSKLAEYTQKSGIDCWFKCVDEALFQVWLLGETKKNPELEGNLKRAILKMKENDLSGPFSLIKVLETCWLSLCEDKPALKATEPPIVRLNGFKEYVQKNRVKTSLFAKTNTAPCLVESLHSDTSATSVGALSQIQLVPISAASLHDPAYYNGYYAYPSADGCVYYSTDVRMSQYSPSLFNTYNQGYATQTMGYGEPRNSPSHYGHM